MLCVRCKKRPAIVFVQKLEAGEAKSEGYCLSCARELGIKPVDDIMKQFGISDQDLEAMEERFAGMMENGDMDPAAMMQQLGMMAPQDDADGDEAPDDDTPVGYEVGMKCPDFTVPLYGEEGGEFTLSAQKGKVTVINFWATWCTPCVAELPYFAELYAEYGDEISLVAIHSNLVTDDVDKFLAKENLDMPFALDKTGAVIKSLGGSTQLPMTVIVDADGKIVYNKVGSVTLTVLEGLVAPLLAE